MAPDSRASHASAYASAHRERFVSELSHLIRFPSVSAQPAHAADIAACACWLADHLRGIGLDHADVIRTPRHPLVYADWLQAAGKPTVLIYGHYDVQPPEPLDAWTTPPFEPVVKNGVIYGRGASDDKGPFFVHLKALESYLHTAGALPVNVKVLLEGEEEIGSPSLMMFVKRHGDMLAADAAVVSDTRIPAPDRPAITISLRGLLSLELEVYGPQKDLHSGAFGGAIHNPLQALCEIIASLHDLNGRVAISGFYDSVRLPSRKARAYFAHVGPSDADILKDAGTAGGWGEPGFSLYERTTIRPALILNGISGGYEGPGPKSVIPAKASAKLSFRLVPDQDPREIGRLLRRHIAQVTPSSVRCQIRTGISACPVLIDSRHRAIQAAVVAYERGFHSKPVYLGSGGTIPVINTLQESMGIQPVLMGFALPSDGMHGPNEQFNLSNFDNGIQTSISFLAEMGRDDLHPLQTYQEN